MSADLPSLIERVEAATGPDRELDFYVWAAINGVTEVSNPAEGHPLTPGKSGRVEGRGPDGKWHLYGWVDPGKVQRNWHPYGSEDRYPAYTASLDAAMTLVPEGWHLHSLGKSKVMRIPWLAMLVEVDDGAPYSGPQGNALSPALALAAAALRSRLNGGAA